MNIKRRIIDLEDRVLGQRGPKPLVDMLLESLDSPSNWYGQLAAAASGPRETLDSVAVEIVDFLEEMGKNDGGRYRRLVTPLDRGVAELLFTDFVCARDRSVFETERLRGVVPDEILAAIYNRQRNYAFGDDAVRLRVRQLAGVLDENGDPVPGYVLRENGCINDA